jgi:cell division protein FtsN
MLSGLLIGLVIGLVLAAGVALWVTGSNPFSLADAPSANVAPPKPAQNTPPPTPETAPSFDFYKVLPGSAPIATPDEKPAAPNQPRYYLQAGAFHNAADADNLKARLALLGVEAQIQTSEVPEKGVFHRVRIGPLGSLDAVNTTRSLLTQNNIPADLVKQPPQPQETP